jgi:hypothetical protein
VSHGIALTNEDKKYLKLKFWYKNTGCSEETYNMLQGNGCNIDRSASFKLEMADTPDWFHEL